jgi:hypothetical protein
VIHGFSDANFRRFSAQFYHVSILRITSSQPANFPTFQQGRQCMNMQGVFISTTNRMDVQGVCLPQPAVWVDVQDVSTYASAVLAGMVYGRAECIPFHHQQCGSCRVYSSSPASIRMEMDVQEVSLSTVSIY